MESFPLFFRIRAITFSIIMLFSFLWLSLICIEMFARWSVADQISHSLMILFVLTNTVTLIMLPMLILVEFRIWLDAARLFLLFLLQVGSAAAGTYWNPKIQCPHQTPDDIGVCQLIGVYTMIACWIIPAILVLYSTYFAVMVYLQSRIPVVAEPERGSGVHAEGSTGSLSSWKEMMHGIAAAQGSNTATGVPPRSRELPNLVHTGQPSLPQSSFRQSTVPHTPRRQATMSSSAHTSQQSLLASNSSSNMAHAGQPPVPQLSRQLTLPYPPRRQATVPSLAHSGQQSLEAPSSLSGRHRSLPAFKHGNLPHLYPAFPLTIPLPLAPEVYPSHTSTPSSHTFSTPSSADTRNQSFSSGPGVAELASGHHQGSSKYLSMPLSSSPREMENAAGSPRKAKLSKPLPARIL